MMEFLFLLVAALAANGMLIKRLTNKARIPIILYGVSYTITCVIGASLLSVEKFYDYWVDMTKSYNNIQVLNAIGGEGYFFLLLSPLVIPQIICILLDSALSSSKKSVERVMLFTYKLLVPIGMTPVFFSFLALSSVCLVDLYFNNLILNSVNITSDANYAQHILARQSAFSKLSNFYFGMIYVGLPTLLVCMISIFLDRKSYIHLFSILFSFGLLIFLILSTVQKGPVVILFIYIGVVFWIKDVLTWKKIAFIFLVAFSYLVLSYNMVGAGEDAFSLTIFQLIYRMGASFPYYLSFFPAHHEFTGSLYGLGFFGFGSDGSETVLISNFMELESAFVQGNVPFGFHITNGYILGGYWTTFVVEIIFGVYLFIASRWCSYAKSAVSIACAVYFTMWSYYLSQSSFSQVLTMQSWCYIWVLFAFVSVFIFWGISKCLQISLIHKKLN